MHIHAYTCRTGQGNLRNDGLQRSNARCDFEEHGPEEVGIRRHLPGTLNEAIVPVKPVKADALFFIGAAGVETTQISDRHMKALDAIGRVQACKALPAVSRWLP